MKLLSLQFYSLPCKLSLEYTDCISGRGISPDPKSMKINCVSWLGSWSVNLRGVKYYFIAMTPRFTLFRNSCNCSGPIYGSNKSVTKLLVSDRNTWYHITVKKLYEFLFLFLFLSYGAWENAQYPFLISHQPRVMRLFRWLRWCCYSWRHQHFLPQILDWTFILELNTCWRLTILKRNPAVFS